MKSRKVSFPEASITRHFCKSRKERPLRFRSQVEPEFSREYEPTPHQLRDISRTSTVQNIRCQTLMSYVSISKMTDVSIKPSFRISSAGSRFRFPSSPNPNAPQAGMSPPGKMYLGGLVGVPMAHEVAPLPIPSPGPLVGARPPYLACLPPPDTGDWSQRCRESGFKQVSAPLLPWHAWFISSRSPPWLRGNSGIKQAGRLRDRSIIK